MKDLIEKIRGLQKKIVKTWKLLKLDKRETHLKELEYAMNELDFWQNQKKAQKITQEYDELKNELETWNKIIKESQELLELAQESEKEKDESIRNDLESKLANLNKQFEKLEFFVLFSEKYDDRNVILAIHAGTGGVEAQDWAAMLLRMYIRFAERKGWLIKIVDKSVGQEAGIKSVTMEIFGKWAYGYLKSEAGVHRLVRISPFDAEKMRHTSFALVEVLPELEEIEEIKIDDKDLRIDTFLSSGHGGQSVQTTYSAVRIVHIPTGITVVCQNERSQQQNKETALKILKSKLHKIYQEEKDKEKQKLRGEYQEAAWGNQIRSYVLQPYKMVKDHRTKYQESEPGLVLDGKLDKFIEAYLRYTKK